MNAPRAVDALIVGAVKLAVSAFVLGKGFRAVSDDDYARVVIAQRFAEAPSLDPSGTSWLPLPFWTYGSVFALFGNGLGVARATALVLGVVASLMVLVAARWLGANRSGALLAALTASMFPTSSWLGAATLPEAPTAGLVVLGMASLSVPDLGRRAIGAVAIALACFCRYEAWPVAVSFCSFAAVDARRSRSWALAVPAFVAVLPIVLWLAHGAVQHGDALFFWKRVASYKAALGQQSSAFVRFFRPVVALAAELPLVVLAAVSVAVRVRSGSPLGAYVRGFACSCALLAFLMVGSLGGGAPTHHEARTSLPIWFFLAIVFGHAVGSRFIWLVKNPLALVPVVAVSFALLFLESYRFVRRDFELHIGDQARRLGAPALLVDTADYGYLAVTAAFRRPRASFAVDDRDPRKPRQADAFASLESLRARLERTPNTWLVATDSHADIASRVGVTRARNARFILVEPKPSR